MPEVTCTLEKPDPRNRSAFFDPAPSSEPKGYKFNITGVTDEAAQQIIMEYTTLHTDYSIQKIIDATIADINKMQPNHKHPPVYQKKFQQDKDVILVTLSQLKKLVAENKYQDASVVINSVSRDIDIIRDFRSALEPIKKSIENSSAARFQVANVLTLTFNTKEDIERFLGNIKDTALRERSLTNSTRTALLETHHAIFQTTAKEIHGPEIREQLGSYRRR